MPKDTLYNGPHRVLSSMIFGEYPPMVSIVLSSGKLPDPPVPRKIHDTSRGNTFNSHPLRDIQKVLSLPQFS